MANRFQILFANPWSEVTLMQESSKITWQARGALLWHQQQHSPPKKAVRSSLVSSVTTAKYTHDHLKIFLHENNLAVNWQMRSCDFLWREKNHLPFLFHHKSLILIRHVYMQICIRAENHPSVCVYACVSCPWTQTSVAMYVLQKLETTKWKSTDTVPELHSLGGICPLGKMSAKPQVVW